MVTGIANKLAALAFICTALLTSACHRSVQGSESWTPKSSLPPSTPEQPAKNGEIKDPIVAMLVAASIDEKGRIVFPHFTFKPEEPQITVVVQVGKVKGSPLVITWYQLTDAGAQKLFEHTIEVRTYERAYSVGKNPGILAPGEYKVTATLEGEMKELRFDVAAPKGAAPPARSPKAPDPPPVDGGSGKTAPPVSAAPPEPSPQSAAGCQVWTFATQGAWPFDKNIDHIQDTADASVSAACADSSNVIVSAQGKKLGDLVVTPGSPQYASFMFDPCSVPRGNDLPGATVHFGVKVSNLSTDPGGSPIQDLVITLGDDTLAPRLDVKSEPARGTRVKAGDKISLKIRSYELRSYGAPWQSGVMDIQVTADPGGLVTSKDYMSYRGKACNEKSWEQSLDTTYTVPSNPAPIIKLCVLTEDFAGNQNSKCGEFRTGNKWKGKLHLVSSMTSSDYGFLCNNETFDGEFSLVVARNGQVQGKGSAHLVAPPQCNFWHPPPAMQTEFEVKGTWGVKGGFDRGQFQLSFAQTGGFSNGYAIATFLWDPSSLSVMHYSRSPEDFTVPVIAPGDAEAQVSNSVTGPHYTYQGQMTVTMLCEDCQ